MGGTPGLRGVWLTMNQAQERTKTSKFPLGTQLKRQRRGSRRALPSQIPGTPILAAHGSAAGRAPKEQSGGLLKEEYQFNQSNFTAGRRLAKVHYDF